MSGLYAWLRQHPRLVDGAMALLLIYPGAGIPKLGILRTLVMLPFVLGMAIPVVFRRAYPVRAFAVVIAVGALQVLMLPRPAGADLAVLVVLYTLAASRPRRVSLRGLAVCLAGAAAAITRWHPARGGLDIYTIGTEAVLFGAPVLLAWLLGDSARWRRGYYQALEERAARLERERDAQAQVAAAAERARIAREIHDVVAHNVSVMVVQADGAAFALDSSPQRAREALAAISATGRRALTEMRSLLGVLRDPPGRDGGLGDGRLGDGGLGDGTLGDTGPALVPVEAVRRHPADVVVMDVRMPRLDGVEATRRICAGPGGAGGTGGAGGARGPRVLMLTTFDLDEYVFAGLQAGASGFLLKDVPPAELLFAIRSVHAGESVVAPSATRRLIDRFVPLLSPAGPPRADLAGLTEREREVLVQVAAGLSNAEIATRLFVSEATVKTHVGRILAKLGLRDRVQAVVLAYESGLVKARGPQ